jgi:serine protease DegQ
MSEHILHLIDFSNAMADAVEKASAATVLVNARKRLPASGVVFETNLILTANHVIERETGIKVLFEDGHEAEASLTGRDHTIDLAVLRMEQPASAIAEKASSEARVGELVLALGRPSPNGIEASLGVVSSIGGPTPIHHGRILERYLRTDTIPYPGFSGGPLINAAGLVIGINTSGLAHGAALTIPADLAWMHGKTLAQHGRLRRGYLGVRSQAVELPVGAEEGLGRAQATGLLLVGVDRESPAAQGGLMVGDIMVGLAGQPIREPDELISLLSGDLVEKSVVVEILRGGQCKSISVTVGERK